jgi:proline iminopeptidase
MSPDPAVHNTAARYWVEWEMAIVAVHSNHKPHPRWENASFRLGFARLVTHYWRHKGWLEDDILVRSAGLLSGIPGILIHGRLDIGGPLITPCGSTRIGQAANSFLSMMPGMMRAIQAWVRVS